MGTRRHAAARYATAVALLSAIVACDSERQDSTASPEPPTASATASATDAAAAPRSPDLDRVAVAMTDFAFEPATLSVAGSAVAVTLTNTGTVAHSFTLDAPSTDTVVEPGGSAQILVSLDGVSEADFYCRFHRDRGMAGTLAVTPP